MDIGAGDNGGRRQRSREGGEGGSNAGAGDVVKGLVVAAAEVKAWAGVARQRWGLVVAAAVVDTP